MEKTTLPTNSKGRFQCPSLRLDPKTLLRATRSILGVSAALAVSFHLCLARIGVAERQHRPAKPLTTQFIKRQPRLTKPMELKKRPQPRRRQVRREMVSVKARTRDRTQATFSDAGRSVGSLARPEVCIGRSVRAFELGGGPPAAAAAIEGTRAPREQVDMALELVDIEALDTGQYQAFVIVDPTDRRAIRGYLHLVLVHLATIAELAGSNGVHTDAGIRKLVQALNEWTDIKADIRAVDDFGSPAALQTPWVYVVCGRSFRLKEQELQAVGAYSASGGFLFCDEGVGLDVASYINAINAFKTMFTESLATQGLRGGKDWSFERLPLHHSLYHCYYDFDGPPLGYWAASMRPYTIYRTEPLQAVVVEDRVVGIITRRCYVAAWYGQGWVLGNPGDMSQTAQQRRAQQFGINTIVFALTQEGSITQRLMSSQ
jgi:hypothetical protein